MQKKKVAGYLRAKKLMDKDGLSQIQACKIAGISRMTFNKYAKMYGDEVSDNVIEVLPKEVSKPKEQPSVLSGMSDLERILKENEALIAQLNIRKELAKYFH